MNSIKEKSNILLTDYVMCQVNRPVLSRVPFSDMVCHIVCKVPGKEGESMGVIEYFSWCKQHPHKINVERLLIPFLPPSSKPVLQFLSVDLAVVAPLYDLPYSLNVDSIACI